MCYRCWFAVSKCQVCRTPREDGLSQRSHGLYTVLLSTGIAIGGTEGIVSSPSPLLGAYSVNQNSTKCTKTLHFYTKHSENFLGRDSPLSKPLSQFGGDTSPHNLAFECLSRSRSCLCHCYQVYLITRLQCNMN